MILSVHVNFVLDGTGEVGGEDGSFVSRKRIARVVVSDCRIFT